MKLPRQAAALLLLALFAGCLGSDTQTDSSRAAVSIQGTPARIIDFSPDWFERAVESDHDHKDISLHQNLSTPNFEVLGSNPLITDYFGTSAGGYFCGTSLEHEGRRLSVVHSFITDVALVISDITDLGRPEKIGELVMANTQVYDVALSPDFRFVALATSPLDAGPDLADAPEPRVMTFRDACTGEERPVAGPEEGLPLASGAVLVDISNPRVPTIVDFRPLPYGGAHSIRIQDIDGRLVVLTTPLSIPIGYVAWFDILDTVAGPKMQAIATYVPYVSNPPLPTPIVSYVHDGYFAKHLVTGQWLLYVAHGFEGLEIVDVSDLDQPVFLAEWNDYAPVGGAESGEHFIHEALPFHELIDGRALTIIGEECTAHPPKVPTCLVHLLDTTEPEDPRFVGAWTLPADVQWERAYQWSTHYLAYTNQTVFVATYHAGVWALDVSTAASRTTLPSIGVFLPSVPSPKPAPGWSTAGTVLRQVEAEMPVDFTPFVMDLDALPDGTLVVYDGPTGIYTVDFNEHEHAAAPAPWPFPYHP